MKNLLLNIINSVIITLLAWLVIVVLGLTLIVASSFPMITLLIFVGDLIRRSLK